MSKLEELKKVIQQANPEREKQVKFTLALPINKYILEPPQITLADILWAFAKIQGKSKLYNPKEWDEQSFVAHNVLKIVGDYNLKDDNLDNQSEDLINFLWEILCNSK